MEYITNIDELSDSSVEVDFDTDKKRISEIIEKLKYRISKDSLIAISAPQIGEKVRIFCIRLTTKQNGKTFDKVHTFVNPVIVGMKGFVLDREKDISLPDREFIIARNNDINIMFQTEKGESVEHKFSGKIAAFIQLMVDHLDGILLTDMGLEIDHLFDEATEEERNELLKAYTEWIESYQKKLTSDIEEDEELSSMSDAIKFIQSVRSGETKLGDEITVDTTEWQKYQEEKNSGDG